MFGLSGISLAGGLYLNQQKIDLKSEYLRRVVNVLHNKVNAKHYLGSEIFYFLSEKPDQVQYNKIK